MATQAAEIYEAQINSCISRKVPPLGSLENPPGSEEFGSAWDAREVEASLQRTSAMEEDQVQHLRVPAQGEADVLKAWNLGALRRCRGYAGALLGSSTPRWWARR